MKYKGEDVIQKNILTKKKRQAYEFKRRVEIVKRIYFLARFSVGLISALSKENKVNT